MKNPTNRDLYAYWNERRGSRIAPERGDIEPTAIRHALGDSFFLAADSVANYPFRLAGTRLCALFGRELKNESFLRLWGKAEQATMRKLVSVVTEEKVGVVAHATGRTSDGAPLVLNLELLLLPLQQRSLMDARVLGALVPMTVPYWFGARILAPLELGMMRHVGPTVEPRSALRLIAGANGTTDVKSRVLPERALPERALPGRALPGGGLPGGGQLRHKFMVYEGGRTD